MAGEQRAEISLRNSIGHSNTGSNNFFPTAHSDLDFEAEPIEAVLQYVDREKIGLPTAIAADADTITFTVSVEALISFSAVFKFFVMDTLTKMKFPRLGAGYGREGHTLRSDDYCGPQARRRTRIS